MTALATSATLNQPSRAERQAKLANQLPPEWKPDTGLIIAELLIYMVAIDEKFAGPRTLACGRLLKRLLYDDGTLEAQLDEVLEARKDT